MMVAMCVMWSGLWFLHVEDSGTSNVEFLITQEEWVAWVHPCPVAG